MTFERVARPLGPTLRHNVCLFGLDQRREGRAYHHQFGVVRCSEPGEVGQEAFFRRREAVDGVVVSRKAGRLHIERGKVQLLTRKDAVVGFEGFVLPLAPPTCGRARIAPQQPYPSPPSSGDQVPSEVLFRGA